MHIFNKRRQNLLNFTNNIITNKTIIFRYDRFLGKNNHTLVNEKDKQEKYSISEVKNFIDKILDLDHREIDLLPAEFQKYSDIIIKLPTKPSLPEDYECCGTGCRPCVWETYDNTLEKINDVINHLYKEINVE